MFVRWKQYQGKPTWLPAGPWDAEAQTYHSIARFDGITYRAYLVESIRTDGRPRQRVVRYLGCIKDVDLDYPQYYYPERRRACRGSFWRNARAALDRVDLHAEVRARCEATLAAVVPQLTEEEEVEAEKDQQKALAMMAMARRG